MKLVKLGNLASIQTGKIDVNKAVLGGKYPFFTCSRNVYEINDAPFEGKAVLVAGNGDLNVKYYEGKFNAYQRTYFLFVNSEEELLPRYLYWFLESYVGQLRSESIGSTIKYIKMSNLTEAKIPLQSLVKQREIVEKLDSAFAEIDMLERNLGLRDEKANQLLQSLLSESFSENKNVESSLQERVIGEICEVGDGNHASKYPTKNEMISSGVPFIRAQNIVNGTVNDSDILYISNQKHELLRKGHLRAGDILITNRGEIGKLAIVPAEFDGSNLNSQIAWLRCKKEVSNSYLYYFLKSESARKYFESGTSGSALQQLTISKLKEIKVPVVSLLDQKAIIEKLDSAFTEIELLKASIKIEKDYAVALRRSLLSSTFTQEEAVA